MCLRELVNTSTSKSSVPQFTTYDLNRYYVDAGRLSEHYNCISYDGTYTSFVECLSPYYEGIIISLADWRRSSKNCGLLGDCLYVETVCHRSD